MLAAPGHDGPQGAVDDEPEKPVLDSGLYIVATPIGNLGDITFRAADILSRANAIACEDTRVTGKLLKHLGISKPLWRYDDHASVHDRERLLGAMQTGAIALVSDAGTPLISDPGYRLVRDARARGIAVTSIPGPSAAITGLTMSGLANDRFMFAGFLPSKEKARNDVLDELKGVPATLIFYETAPRLLKSLAAIAKTLPGREISVARELTKTFEECRTGTPETLMEHYDAKPPKGEIVLMIAPPTGPVPDDFDVDAMLGLALQSMKASQAAGQVARATGMDRKMLYARAMEIKQQ